MSTPKRIQRKRTKGWRMPLNAVYVGRPTKWGNPWPVARYGEVVVEWYEHALRTCIDNPYGMAHTIEFRNMADSIEQLRGHDLACWCKPSDVCHADVLLEIANQVTA